MIQTPGRIGFIGLGHMGGPMAERLVHAGYSLMALDTAGAALQRLVDLGAAPADSPAHVAAHCDLVFLALPTPESVEHVASGSGGLVRQTGNRPVVIDLSTTGPEAEHRLDAALQAAGLALIDCPVSGGPRGARDGTLALIAAAPLSVLDLARPALGHLGKLFHVGERPGMAQSLKLINNLLSLTALVASSEAVALGVKAGLDPVVILEVINASSGRNTSTSDKIPRHVMTRRFDFGIAVGLSAKDARLCIDHARDLGASMEVGAVVERMLTRTAERFGAEMDLTYAVRLIEEFDGVIISNDSAGLDK